MITISVKKYTNNDIGDNSVSYKYTDSNFDNCNGDKYTNTRFDQKVSRLLPS